MVKGVVVTTQWRVLGFILVLISMPFIIALCTVYVILRALGYYKNDHAYYA